MIRTLRPHLTRLFIGALLALLLAGCGFQLRGSAALPFASMLIDGGAAPTVAPDVVRAVRASGKTRIAQRIEEAEVILQFVGESRDKRILSLGSSGRVREYELLLKVSFRLLSGPGDESAPLQTVELRRDFSYDDARVLAKEQEETALLRDMQIDAVQQVMRRLAASRVTPQPGRARQP